MEIRSIMFFSVNWCGTQTSSFFLNPALFKWFKTVLWSIFRSWAMLRLLTCRSTSIISPILSTFSTTGLHLCEVHHLSLAADFDGSRTSAAANRYSKTATSSNDFTQCTSTAGTAKNIPLDSSPQRFTQNDNFPPHQQFFNCAAPKSVLHQNCQVMRQVQKQYPPCPRHVRVYQIHPPPGVPFGPIAKKSAQQKLFTNSTLPSSNQSNS
ncbi:uncharacterized protein ACN2A1_003554 [Glossina fuscipes fuscipes]